MAWKPKDPRTTAGSGSGAPVPNPQNSLPQLNRSMQLEFRGASSIRLFAILAGAMMIGLGVQVGNRFSISWIPFAVVPIAWLLMGWAIGFRIWAYDDKIQIRSMYGSRIIPLDGAETAIVANVHGMLGQKRPTAIFVGNVHPVQHYRNHLLTKRDFANLLNWTQLPIVELPGIWKLSQLEQQHPELLQVTKKKIEPDLVWTALTLVQAALFAAIFFWFASR